MMNILLYCGVIVERELRRRKASRRLLAALLANEREEAERLLALGVSLRGTRWPGNFTALHAAALSNCWSVLPALLDAAGKEGIFIDSRLASGDLSKAIPKFFAKLGFALAMDLDGSFADNGRGAFPSMRGISPLQLACWAGSMAVIPILLAHGAVAGNRFCSISQWSAGDALQQLLYGVRSSDAAELLPTVTLLLQHGADPLARRPPETGAPLSRTDGLRCYCVADERMPVEVRHFLVNYVKVQHQQGQFRVIRDAELLLVHGAALCGDDDALLYFGRHAFQQMGAELALAGLSSPGHQSEAQPSAPFLDVLEVLPLIKSDFLLQEMLATRLIDAAGVQALLEDAVMCLRPKLVRASLPHIFGHRAHVNVVDASELSAPRKSFWHLSNLGHSLVWTTVRLLGPLTSSSLNWQHPGMAVLAHLTGAEWKPSKCPVARASSRIQGSTRILNYSPLEGAPQMLPKLAGLVLLALQQPAWSRASHNAFPPAFQAAARTFLLAAATRTQKRHQQVLQGQPTPGVQQAGPCLGDLPAPLLERVVGLAAYPCQHG